MSIFNSISKIFINLYKPGIETPLTLEEISEMLVNDIHRMSITHCSNIVKDVKNNIQNIGYVGIELMYLYLHMLDINLLENFNDEVRNKIFNNVSVKTIQHLAKETYSKIDISTEAKGALSVELFNTMNSRQDIYSKCKELCVGHFLSAQGSKLFVLNYYIHKEMMLETIINNNIDEDLLTGKRPIVQSDIKYLPILQDAINIYAVNNIKNMNEKWNILFKNSKLGHK